METNVQMPAIHSSQRGAALVTSLVLLLVLTILAVAGINSVTMEYAMTGNEQFRANAFTAAEAGIEQSLVQGTFIPGAANQTIGAQMVNTQFDNYAAVIAPILGGAPQNPPLSLGASIGKISSYQFEITSTGTSLRSAQAVNVQGVAVIAPYDPSIPPDPLGTTTQLN
jgi:type IV pilus assembly protein PilX